ncbi:hypothetical protein BDV26DRAFT_82392 [Aspergillus bertholletiae]|uniref:Linalool dehydratase/isomerase domain-containing protein n=1 Tax=Aspergillus bertholletiae TaxID=1226010 RepID=A0A5N7ASM5_9EURO|nr:hypothetical protein BDV26DRAFT_82392 [Aspergillus bertholletiae]
MAPSTLALDTTKYPKLTREQAGHIRHIHNISTELGGNWPHMGTQDPAQAFLDAHRYQISTMAYSLGLAHYHHLPAMRSLFQTLFHRVVHKMLHPEVWAYWYLTSQSGVRLDPALTELRKPWADPIIRENIMYSGHLLLMTSLYAMLFDDDEFEQPGSLSFDWDPLLWGMGPQRFEYDNGMLQQVILTEMEKTGWVGVCCEPNWVFIVCNQFPIIAMRYNDVRHGTNVVDGVLEKYWEAVQKRGMIAPDGLYVDWLLLRQESTVQKHGIGFTAWANAFMNAWNSEFVRSSYAKQAAGFITHSAGGIQLQHPGIGATIREAMATENADPNSPETIQRAREKYLRAPPSGLRHMLPHFGYVVTWLSELGKRAELDALLCYADSRFAPTWERGGLYYPRRDQIFDESGEWAFVDPFTGNAAIGYARLNVEDGQKKMWEKPWTREDLRSRPWVDGLDYSLGVDCLRGWWDGDEQAMVVALRAWEEKTDIDVKFYVRNLPAGGWAVYEDGCLVVEHQVAAGSDVEIACTVGHAQDVEIVVIRS